MWKTISSKVIFEHPRLTLKEDRVKIPSGKEGDYLVFESDGRNIVSIICKREDGKLLIQKQLTYPLNKEVYQFPGGSYTKDEDPEEAANRELGEESGLNANSLEYLGKHLLDNRRSTAFNKVYFATDLKIVESNPEPEEEDLENIWMTEEDIDKKIRNGEMIVATMLSAWAIYKTRK